MIHGVLTIRCTLFSPPHGTYIQEVTMANKNMSNKRFCEICGIEETKNMITDFIKKDYDKLEFINHRMGLLCGVCLVEVLNIERERRLRGLSKNGK
jgi:hypothetical protein